MNEVTLPIQSLHRRYDELCNLVQFPGRLRAKLRDFSPNDLTVLKTVSPPLLLVTAARGSPASVLVLTGEFDFDWQVEHGDAGNALLWAVRGGNLPVVDFLLAYEDLIAINCRTAVTGRTALHIAAEVGGSEMMQLLLSVPRFEEVYPVNAADHSGSTPLHVAVLNHHQEVVRLLLAVGADTSAINSKARVPLFDAIDSCDLDLIPLLLPRSKMLTYHTPEQYTITNPILSDGMTIQVLETLSRAKGGLEATLSGTGVDLYNLALRKGKQATANVVMSLIPPAVVPSPFR